MNDPDQILQYAQPGNPIRNHGWDALGWIASSRDKRDAATWYARLGLHPILLHGITESGACTCNRDCGKAAGKHPVQKGWQKAPLDLIAIDSALAEDWRLNLGLRMGVQPGGSTLIAIDVDGPRSLLAPLERENGALPNTLTASTGEGLHLIYRFPAGTPAPKNRVSLAPGVDIRSEGGQIVAAPSVHRNGQRYTWLHVCEPAELPQ